MNPSHAYYDEDRATVVVYTQAVQHVLLDPLWPGHPCIGVVCAVCGDQLRAGDQCSAIALGPVDAEQAQAAERGEPYEAVGAVVHTRCAGPGPATRAHPSAWEVLRP